jgi:hypothetical protein
MPVSKPTVAKPGGDTDQKPPPGALVYGVPTPTQILGGPAIGAGFAATVTTVVAKQPVGMIYDMTVVPGATPVTTPVAAFTVPMAVEALDQVPPAGVVVRVVVAPTHTLVGPVIALGVVCTVTTRVA